MMPNSEPPKPAFDHATIQRLVRLYGREKALRIIDGRDRDFNADLAKWRNLGRRG